jgi:stage V sporulation protein R
VRPPYPEYAAPPAALADDDFRRRFAALDPDAGDSHANLKKRAPVPPFPERDLLWFIAQYAPELEGWERDVFLAVREESYYFYPVFATQIMNEGWASYWHARLLRESDFLPQDVYVDAIKCHSDVVRPIASGEQVALAVNPYHLGFSMWEKIVEKRGIDAARAICAEEDDFGFVRNYLDADLAADLDLFVYEASADGEIKVASRDIHAIREAILAPKFNFGSPRVAATSVGTDGTLTLAHDHESDGRGLDLSRAERVLDYVVRLWRRPVTLHTIDDRGHDREITKRP